MISRDRRKHILAVACYLKKFAKDQNMTDEDCEELFTLGLFHDIGYEFLEEKDYKKHNIKGGELLKSQGYKYWKEVYYHGVVNSPYQSYFLDLLNWADMHIDSVGNYVSFEDRLKEISARYNTDIKDLDCTRIVEELKQKGYK